MWEEKLLLLLPPLQLSRKTKAKEADLHNLIKRNIPLAPALCSSHLSQSVHTKGNLHTQNLYITRKIERNFKNKKKRVGGGGRPEVRGKGVRGGGDPISSRGCLTERNTHNKRFEEKNWLSSFLKETIRGSSGMCSLETF